MSLKPTQSQTSRRGDLLAELFFEEFDPVFVSRPTTPDAGYDLLVAFSNEKAGINTFAVEVKSTEQQLGSKFPLQRRRFDRIAHSNIPGLLLVADVKRVRLYFAWLKANAAKSRGKSVLVPLVEVTERTKAELKERFHKATDGMAVAG